MDTYIFIDFEFSDNTPKRDQQSQPNSSQKYVDNVFRGKEKFKFNHGCLSILVCC